MRAAMNANLYCPWRFLSRDSFPARSTVYNISRKFPRDGVWEAIWAELHMTLRGWMGPEASPRAAALDSQSVEPAEKGVDRAPLFELSTTNCTAQFRFLHLQKICRRIFPLG